jgi:hypothetical protein
VCALCHVHGQHDSPNKSMPQINDVEISRLITLPEYQGRGAATWLLNRVCSPLHRAGHMCVLHTRDAGAVRFFTSSEAWQNSRRKGNTNLAQCFYYIGMDLADAEGGTPNVFVFERKCVRCGHSQPMKLERCYRCKEKRGACATAFTQNTNAHWSSLDNAGGYKRLLAKYNEHLQHRKQHPNRHRELISDCLCCPALDATKSSSSDATEAGLAVPITGKRMRTCNDGAGSCSDSNGMKRLRSDHGRATTDDDDSSDSGSHVQSAPVVVDLESPLRSTTNAATASDTVPKASRRRRRKKRYQGKGKRPQQRVVEQGVKRKRSTSCAPRTATSVQRKFVRACVSCQAIVKCDCRNTGRDGQKYRLQPGGTSSEGQLVTKSRSTLSALSSDSSDNDASSLCTRTTKKAAVAEGEPDSSEPGSEPELEDSSELAVTSSGISICTESSEAESDVVDQAQPVLSAYERIRLVNKARNEVMMRDLGLLQTAAKPAAADAPSKRRVPGRARASDRELAVAVTRQSTVEQQRAHDADTEVEDDGAVDGVADGRSSSVCSENARRRALAALV